MRQCKLPGCQETFESLAHNQKFCCKEHGRLFFARSRKQLSFGKRYMRLEDFQALLAERSNRCDMCGQVLKRAYVDHDHKTGEFRGILCNRCNVGLHYMEDSIFVENASRYLEGK